MLNVSLLKCSNGCLSGDFFVGEGEARGTSGIVCQTSQRSATCWKKQKCQTEGVQQLEEVKTCSSSITGERQDGNKAYCLASSLIVWEVCSGKRECQGDSRVTLEKSGASRCEPSACYSFSDVFSEQCQRFLIFGLLLSNLLR